MVKSKGGNTTDLTGVSASVGGVAARPASTRTVSPYAGVTIKVKITTDDHPRESQKFGRMTSVPQALSVPLLLTALLLSR